MKNPNYEQITDPIRRRSGHCRTKGLRRLEPVLKTLLRPSRRDCRPSDPRLERPLSRSRGSGTQEARRDARPVAGFKI